MDNRAARRAAEQAARQLMNERSALVGEIAVARAGVVAAQNAATVARDEARRIVRAARDHASELVAAAETRTKDADRAYAATRTAAITAGWQGSELVTLGFAAVGREQKRTIKPEVGEPRPEEPVY